MGTDRITKLLLGLIAAGIWALVLLTGVTTSRLNELNTEVKAIGLDTERIHEDLDPAGEDEDSDRSMSRSHMPRGRPHARTASAGRPPL